MLRKTNRLTNYFTVYSILSGILVFLFIWSLVLGPLKVSPHELDLCLLGNHTLPVCHVIISTRLPRTIAALMSGSGFALAGIILFYVTRNPLACPSLLGINQGAIMGILLCLIIFPLISLSGLVFFAVCGGVIAGLAVYLIVSAIGTSTLKLVLVGQAINIFLYALSQTLIMLFPDKTGGMLIMLNGSLAGTLWQKIIFIIPLITLTFIFTFLLAKKIYLLSLGKEIALSIGIDADKLLIITFGLIIILCSLSVAMVGQLLFFPLITTQISKALQTSRNPYHMCVTACLSGAVLMLGSDCIMRYFFIGQEVPLGIFMAIIGAPILIFYSRLKRSQA